MSAASRRALAFWALTMLLIGVALALSIGRDLAVDLISYTLLPLIVATVGAMVVARHPQHRVGWIFVGFGIYLALIELIQGYGLLAADLGLPGRDVTIWVWTWIWTYDPAIWAVVAAVFPDGHLLSRAWRWVPWTAAVGATLVAVGMAFSSVQDNYFPEGVDPLYRVEGLLPLVALSIGTVVTVASLMGGITALVLRLRQARGVEREQLRLFAITASAVVALSLAGLVVASFVPSTSTVIEVLAFNGFPIAAAVGVAILRYRLYDIDVVIKRTITYATLTAVLVGTYVLTVLLLRGVLLPSDDQSDLVVAVSTLGVAALFRPLRSAIQGFVDRRFSRARYDAAKTLDTFAGRLRHELDLDSLGTDLRGVVDETMQPEHVSLWIRSETSR